MAEVSTAAPPAIANPAALGLGGFALTTFVLSTHNAGLAPNLTWLGLAFFYGGLAQFAAGMWEFKTGNTFGATAFSTYGAFWAALATFVLLLLNGKVPAGDVDKDLGWFLLSFAIFNTYMLFWSTRLNRSVFLVFLTLEITEILLFIGFFSGNKAGEGLVALGGYVGIITAIGLVCVRRGGGEQHARQADSAGRQCDLVLGLTGRKSMKHRQAHRDDLYAWSCS